MLRSILRPAVLNRPQLIRKARRAVSTATSDKANTSEHVAPEQAFGADDEIIRLCSLPHRRPTLADLVRFGTPPLKPSALLASARSTRDIIPVRLARRILALRNLPYIVVTNPHIQQIFQLYNHSFDQLHSFPQNFPSTLDEETQFADVLADIVQAHSNIIPTLARGFQEAGTKFMSGSDITVFLERHFRARIGTRLIAEQHLALHNQTLSAGTDITRASFVGIIDTALSPAEVIRRSAEFVQGICEMRYGIKPEIELHGNVDCKFTYIPMHMEYMLTELFKNAFRATVESGNVETPVQVTIAPTAQGDSLTIRIRDHGGGIDPENLSKIWQYSFTTFFGDEGLDALGGIQGGSSIAGLGYGLPLSRAYAEYFGGDLTIQSCFGWGTDCYLNLKGLGGIKE